MEEWPSHFVLAVREEIEMLESRLTDALVLLVILIISIILIILIILIIFALHAFILVSRVSLQK